MPDVAVTSTVTRMPSYRSSCSKSPDGETSEESNTTGGGSGLPADSTVIESWPLSSVIGGLDGSAEGRNSCTMPVTRTSAPRETGGADPVNTRRPSDVCGSASQSATGASM